MSYTKSKKIIYFICIAIVLAAIGPNSEIATASGNIPDEIKLLLNEYSIAISSQDTNLSDYSEPVQKLVTDRKNYYREFWEKGLHSKLLKVNSKFKTDNAINIRLNGNVYEITLLEEVSMFGEPYVKLPDEFPLIQAAKWAIDNTNNPETKVYLSKYIETMSKGVEQSAKDGITIIFKIEHNFTIEKIDKKLKIKTDVFSDKSNDNKNGFDNVSWVGNKFNRHKPNWDDFPDYQIYNMPIDAIGRMLLQDYEMAASASPTVLTTVPSNYIANGNSAVWYILNYTSNPDYTHYVPCGSGNPSVLQDTSFYNPDYSDVWNITGCNDCADYVSQALAYAGFPTDNTWYAGAYVPVWIRPFELKNYFQFTIEKGDLVQNLVSLKTGDLAFIYKREYQDETLNWQHVAMISGINPYRYSAHTYDRYNYAINPDFNRFMVIKYTNFIYLPMVTAGNSPYAQGISPQQPYPDPIDYNQNVPPVIMQYPEAYPTP